MWRRGGDVVEPKDLPGDLFELSPGTRYEITMHEAVREVKRQYLIDAVVESGGDWAKAGKRLNLHAKTVPRNARQAGSIASEETFVPRLMI